MHDLGFAEVRRWATERALDLYPRMQRIAMVWVTESYGGLNLCNDGRAYPAAGETPWTVDENGDPFPELDLRTEEGQNRRAALRRYLQRSMTLPGAVMAPDGKPGGNGGSTGPAQQLSKGFVALRFPGKSWGWGSLEDTMNPTMSTRMTLDAMPVTSRTTYKDVTGLDPIAADVLFCQNPAPREAAGANYGATNVTRARALVDNWLEAHP